MVQDMQDIEELPEGAISNYTRIADTTERLRTNVEALYICKAYYVSHVYNRVEAPRFSDSSWSGSSARCLVIHAIRQHASILATQQAFRLCMIFCYMACLSIAVVLQWIVYCLVCAQSK